MPSEPIFSSAFFELLLTLSEAGLWVPKDMLRLMCGESGLYPWALSPAGYEGLTQIGSRELASLGWDVKARGAFRRASPEVQLPFTAAYFDGWRRRLKIPQWLSAGHLWMCNLAPAHLTRESGIVYDDLHDHGAYQANKWLDINRDGAIMRGELDVALDRAVKATGARFVAAMAGLAEARRASAGDTCEPPADACSET